MYPDKVVWYVVGADTGLSWPVLFNSREAAEKHAAKWLPDQPEDDRKARVMFRQVFSIGEV